MTRYVDPVHLNRARQTLTSLASKVMRRPRSTRVCLLCGQAVPDAHQPYGWLEKRYGNGLLCGSGPCLEAALRLAGSESVDE